MSDQPPMIVIPLRPPLLLQAERIPVVILLLFCGIALLSGFWAWGISVTWAVIPVCVFIGGMYQLRRIAEYDPQYFRIIWMRWWAFGASPFGPLHLPYRRVLFVPHFLRKQWDANKKSRS